MIILNLEQHNDTSQQRKAPLTRKELAILQLGSAYGFSSEGIAKLILGLRKRQERDAKVNKTKIVDKIINPLVEII